MEDKAKSIVLNYLRDNMGHHNVPSSKVFMVWSCYILGNRKYLFGYSESNHYFELTHNVITKEWYLDVYTKKDNRVIK